MRLWTLQPENVYESLIRTGLFRCDPTLSECIDADPNHFVAAYSWMRKQMKRRVGPPPDGVLYPVWAWYVMNGRRKRPDFRWREMYFDKPMVCMEIEIPDDQVLLSDEEMWHLVLNDIYIDKDDDDYDRWEGLPESQKIEKKEKSWEAVLNIADQPYIQATFWELKLEQVKKVWHLKPRLSQS